MISSRGLCVLRQTLCQINRRNPNLLLSRSGHAWSYRVGAPPHSSATKIGAEVVGAFMWWWILWHLWHEHEHVTGEFPYPNPRNWTDAELGIPAEDEE